MSNALPLIDILRAAQTDRDRATWLSAVPLHFVSTSHAQIKAVLDEAAFAAGVAYLEALHAQQLATRLVDGRHPATVVLTTQAAHSDMWEGVRLSEAGA